jgi:hypothetical protein
MGDTYAKQRLYRNPDGSLVTADAVVFGHGLAYAEGDLIEDDNDVKKAKGYTTAKAKTEDTSDSAALKSATPTEPETDGGNTVAVTNENPVSNPVEGADAGTPKERRAARAAAKA